MVVLKTSRELKAMRDAGRISSRALKLAGEAVEPGVSTLEIDRIVRKYICLLYTSALPLTNIPTGTFIHNVELYPGKGGQLARSAGNMAQLMAKENGMALLRLPSGELRNVSALCMATVGQVSNTCLVYTSRCV